MKFFPVSAQDYKITLWNCFHLRVPTFAGSISVTIFQKKKKKRREDFQTSKLSLSQQIFVPDIVNENMEKTVAEELISLSSLNLSGNKAQSISKLPLILSHPLFPIQMLDLAEFLQSPSFFCRE